MRIRRGICPTRARARASERASERERAKERESERLGECSSVGRLTEVTNRTIVESGFASGWLRLEAWAREQISGRQESYRGRKGGIDCRGGGQSVVFRTIEIGIGRRISGWGSLATKSEQREPLGDRGPCARPICWLARAPLVWLLF